MSKKSLTLLFAGLLVLGSAVSGTLAWLTDQSTPVSNSFCGGNIQIGLLESTGSSYQMTPGVTVTKDPEVFIRPGSQPCYLFVELQQKNGEVTYTNAAGATVTTKWSDFLSYEIDSAVWQNLAGQENVYYRIIDDETARVGNESAPYHILKDDAVSVKHTVTKEMMQALQAEPQHCPALNVSAYAVQYYKTNGVPFEPAEAWQERPKSGKA